MQNKKTPLLYALICLSVTIPMLSGCKFTGGPVYKTSSYQFYNPFSSKSKDYKDYDDSALVGKFDDPYGHSLPKQDVAPPPGGYLKDTAQETRMATANNRGRTSADSINELRNAELARNSNAAGSTGMASSKPKPDSMLSPTGNMTAANQTQAGPYGTTTPIDPGFGAGSGQFPAQQPQFANTQYSANSGMAVNGQPSFDPYNQQIAAGQINPQNQAGFPGQPDNMTASTAGNSQYPYLNTPDDPMFGVNPNAGIPAGSPVAPQMVAMNQGTGYGGYNNAPMFNSPTQSGSPTQSATPQGVGTMPQNAAMPGVNPNAGYGPQSMPNGSMSNGQGTNDPGFGTSGFGNPANSGMGNPSATGTTGYPAFAPSQTTMQSTPQGTQTYPGYGTPPQQPANNGYQNGFSYFGPTDNNDYRPGSTYGGW